MQEKNEPRHKQAYGKTCQNANYFSMRLGLKISDCGTQISG